jgi:hypothetical protein
MLLDFSMPQEWSRSTKIYKVRGGGTLSELRIFLPRTPALLLPLSSDLRPIIRPFIKNREKSAYSWIAARQFCVPIN